RPHTPHQATNTHHKQQTPANEKPGPQKASCGLLHLTNGAPALNLKDNIRLLTQPHIGYNHAGKIVKQDSLLRQLNKAERTGGTPTTSEKPIPANINAVALAQDILKEAQQHQYEMHGTTRGSLWAIILSWQKVEDKEWVAFLEHVTQDWIDAIRNLINP